MQQCVMMLLVLCNPVLCSALYPQAGKGSATLWAFGRHAYQHRLVNIVIQHRLALDTLLVETGSVCKLLATSCCFYIPDSHQNLTNTIEHMRSAIRTPPQTRDSGFDWLNSIFG